MDKRLAHAGVTLVQMLLAVAIVGTLLAVGFPALHNRNAHLLSQDLRALLQEARYEAIKLHTPVALTWDGSGKRFSTRYIAASTDIDTVCTSGTVLRSKSLSDYRDVALSSNDLAGGIVWLPSGLVRECDGSSLTSALTTVISDGRSSYTLAVTPAGQVTLQ